MAQWIVEELLPCRQISEAVDRLAEAATTAFAKERLPASVKRTAIVAAGCAKVKSRTGEPHPLFTGDDQATGFTISNFVEPDGTERAAARPDFEPLLEALKPGVPAALWDVGQSLNSSEGQELTERVLEILRHEAGNRVRLIEAVVDTVRAVAARNPLVGSNVLVTVIPRTAVSRAEMGDFQVTVQSLDAEGALSLFFGSDDDTYVGPDYVCEGLAHHSYGVTRSLEEAEEWFKQPWR